MSQNIFEKASRKKLRFDSARGQLSVEQLWDLPLTGANSLDKIAVALDTEIRSTAPISFVSSASTDVSDLTLKFEIVRHIIAVRLAEKNAKEERAQLESRLREVRQARSKAELDALLSKTPEELAAEEARLQAMLNKG